MFMYLYRLRTTKGTGGISNYKDEIVSAVQAVYYIFITFKSVLIVRNFLTQRILTIQVFHKHLTML